MKSFEETHYEEFSQLLFWQKLQEDLSSLLLFVDDSRFINDSHYEFGKMFVTRITCL